ncbi:MAG: serine/threonine protein kinase [Halanaerobiales bacterium]
MPEEPDYMYLPSGTVINNRYVVKKNLVERSNQAIVYLAFDQNEKKEVVIKEFFPRDLVLRGLYGIKAVLKEIRLEDEFARRKGIFNREARLVSKFNNNNIVKVYNSFDANDTSYIVFKYYRAPNLRQFLSAGELSMLEFFRKIFFPLLDTVDFIHKKNYLHGDIKPDNIIITKEGPVLLDFGSAINFKKNDREQMFISPGFSPLEFYSPRARKGPYSDIYSFTALFYYFLTGREPAPARKRIHEDPLRLPGASNKEVSPYLNKLIKKNLSLHSSGRDKNIKTFKTKFLFAYLKLRGERLIKRYILG